MAAVFLTDAYAGSYALKTGRNHAILVKTHSDGGTVMHTLNLDIFKAFHSDWALLTAGDPKDYNTMTISWGGLGTLWSRSVATVYVRPCRYTYEYMEKNQYFTLSFYTDAYKPDLKLLGTRSGRDGDKVAMTSLTPVPAGESTTFAQAKMTLLCRKLYAQELDAAAIPAEIAETQYGNEAPHKMYIGEVVSILGREE